MRVRAVALIALLVVVPLAGCLEGGLVGEPAPAFSLVTSDGQIVNESTHLGKFLVLDLMASWCGPCRLEVGHLREIQRTYGDRVAILSVGVDPGESMSDLAAFSEKYGATWPHGLDADTSIGRAYGLNIIPKLVIIDPQGVVVFERQGEVLPAAMARVIDPTTSAAAPDALALTFVAALLAGVAGFLAVHNPYRKLHRDALGARPAWIALGGFVVLGALAWVFGGVVSSRATYGSLALGALTLGAAFYWARARAKPRAEKAPSLAPEAGDRMYEAAPHFALSVVLGLLNPGAVGFVAPLLAFVAGAAAGIRTRDRVPEALRTRAGLLGLGLVGLGLLLFGARILFAYGS